MAGKITQPINQVRLTNVAIVRMKKAGKRFEIACYKNKVVSWRNKVEKDIDEVLQTPTVFINVSKGQVAKKEDLMAAFETDNQLDICKIILDKGELQVSDKERHQHQEELYREIATLISGMCLDPNTSRAHPVTMVEKAMHDAHFSVNPNKSSKQQALELIPKLREHLAIERAKMQVRVTVAQKAAKSSSTKLKQMFEEIDVEDWVDGSLELVGLINPGTYRALDDFVMKETKGMAKLEVLSLKKMTEVDTEL